MEFLPPPQASMNFSVPPPPLQQQSQIQQLPPSMPPHQPHSHQHYPNQPRERHFHGGFSGKSGQQHFRSFNSFGRGPGGAPMSQDDFDGKRLRKSVMRKTVDYNSSIVRALEVSQNSTMIIQEIRVYCIIQSINLLFIIVICRTDYGNVTIAIDVLYNRKVFMLQKCFHHPVIWIIRQMR